MNQPAGLQILLLILPVVAILLVSGCTIPGTDIEIPFLSDWFGPAVEQDTADVVVISSLRAIPDTVVPGQTFRIVSYIQNKGSKTIPLDQSDLKTTANLQIQNSRPVVELYD